MYKAGSLREGRRDEADGLTIVELLIALFIVMLTFAVLASTVIASFASIRNNEARVRGVALANELVEEMATIPWMQLGLYEDDDRLDLSEVDEDEGEILEFEDEAVVLLTDDADPIPSHKDDIERDGRTYQVKRWVTWVEEDDRPELKRMVAIVEWEVAGRDFTIRSDALRAPDAQDLFDLGVSVDKIERDVDGMPGVELRPEGYTVEKDGEEKPVGLRNSDAFTVTATVGHVDASVVLRFRSREGAMREWTTSDTPEGQDSVRTLTIPQHAFRFAHGPTAFTVYATGPDGQVASDTGSFRFYQDLKVSIPEVTQGGDVVTEGEKLRVDSDHRVCEEVTVKVEVEGMTSGEANPQPVFDDDGEDTDEREGGLFLTVDDGVEQDMELLQGQDYGGTFGVTFDVGSFLGAEIEEGETEFRVEAERWFQDEDLRAEFGAEDDSSAVVTIEIAEGCLS